MNTAPIIYFYPGDSGGTQNAWQNLLPADHRGRYTRHTRIDRYPGPSGRGLAMSRLENVLIPTDHDEYAWRRIGPDIWAGVREYSSEEFLKPVPASPGRYTAPGYTVPMGDGREWVIPVALADAPNYRVPWRETLDPDGRIVHRVDPAYTAVCAAAETLWAHIDTSGEHDAFRMPEDQLRAACVNALQVNYHLDLVDALTLGLFTSESYRALIGAVLDLPAIDELLAKKACAPSGTPSGSPDGSSATSQPMPTSST